MATIRLRKNFWTFFATSLALGGCSWKPELINEAPSSAYPAIWADVNNCSLSNAADPRARDLIATFALLSSVVYMSEVRPEEREDAGKEFVLPGGWERNDMEAIPGDPDNGLFAALFLRPAVEGSPPMAVFAFRGTEPKAGAFWNDLKASVAPGWHKAPQQYRTAKSWVSEHVANLKKNHFEIYATGHSLGGGIAQFIAYQFSGITAVVFNPSPRTAFGSLVAGEAEYFNPPVCRVVETYELVGLLPGPYVPTIESEKHANRHYCTTVNQFRWYQPLAGHDIGDLAWGLLNNAPSGELRKIAADRIQDHRRVAEEHLNATPGALCAPM